MTRTWFNQTGMRRCTTKSISAATIAVMSTTRTTTSVRAPEAAGPSVLSSTIAPPTPYSSRMAVWLDARETLGAFMEGGKPNAEYFMATVGSVFERLLGRRSYLIVRGYGEMVDLLWKDGNAAGALEVERLWNELARKYKYSLLCGYALDNFMHETHIEGFRHICAHHSHALPFSVAREDVA